MESSTATKNIVVLVETQKFEGEGVNYLANSSSTTPNNESKTNTISSTIIASPSTTHQQFNVTNHVEVYTQTNIEEYKLQAPHPPPPPPIKPGNGGVHN
ncbi:hypothetical protein BVRB_6g139500 [Beta vulgaris subsp. vulgaris]|nr:hypothetical protein BVRB_6g139500 [Beta vulgaris subsp. vulgaris]